LKKKAVAITLLMLMSISIVLMPPSLVLGQLGVNIYLVTPQDQASVSQEVNIQGTINTQNGEYKLWFGSSLVISNTSDGFYVDAKFKIPSVPEGSYSIILQDVKENVNATQAYTVIMGYYIEAGAPTAPAQFQEGSNIVLNVTLTGAKTGTAYLANVTIELPAPLNTNYSRVVELPVSIETAEAHVQITFPDAAFEPAGSLTDYAGLYKVYLNRTESLAENQFLVGFTDLTEYHRGQSVTIRAVGYQPDDNSMISIENVQTGANVNSQAATASSEGIITAVWTVPFDALIGDYNVTITPENTSKLIPDSQLFAVPGYPVKVKTVSLAGTLVFGIVVEALDQATNSLYNGTSSFEGIALLNLESGNHTLSAFWNDVKVGEINASITGETTLDLICELTNLKITVQDVNGNLIPFVSLDITYNYVTTRASLSRTGSASGETDLSGTFTLNSTLPRISYTINASIYGIVFNTNNNTVTELPPQPISEVVIICPSRTLTLRIIDYNRAAIPNARLELVEITSGLFYAAVTDEAGARTMDVTFGKYRLRVYGDNILLNETIVEVFSDSQSEIRCSLYNIHVSVTVVDYFNQPIPNANVMLHGPGRETLSATTESDGTKTFSNVIGGNMQIIAYLSGTENAYEAVNLQIEEPTTVQIKIAKYVLLGPFLIETSLLATFIIILAAILLFLSIEVYRRKRAKPVNSES
jgi:hypothetical protein